MHLQFCKPGYGICPENVILACPESFRLVRNLKKDSRQAGMTDGLAYINIVGQFSCPFVPMNRHDGLSGFFADPELDSGPIENISNVKRQKPWSMTHRESRSYRDENERRYYALPFLPIKINLE